MRNSDLRHSVLNSPGACCLLIARGAMSAEKHGVSLDEHILSYARQDQKLREAIQTAAGVSLRNVAEIIDEERREFWYARMRRRALRRERGTPAEMGSTGTVPRSRAKSRE